jgi:Fe-S cluster biogenesis protein NfuA
MTGKPMVRITLHGPCLGCSSDAATCLQLASRRGAKVPLLNIWLRISRRF